MCSFWSTTTVWRHLCWKNYQLLRFCPFWQQHSTSKFETCNKHAKINTRVHMTIRHTLPQKEVQNQSANKMQILTLFRYHNSRVICSNVSLTFEQKSDIIISSKYCSGNNERINTSLSDWLSYLSCRTCGLPSVVSFIHVVVVTVAILSCSRAVGIHHRWSQRKFTTSTYIARNARKLDV